MTNADEIADAIKKMLVTDLFVEVGADEMGLDDSLRNVFGLDSLGFVELRVQCENQFGVRIADRDFTPDTFGSIRAVSELIQRQLSAGGGQDAGGGSQVGPADVSKLLFERRVHIDHYAGNSLPFASLRASGLVQRFVELAGQASGSEFDVIDASGGYGSACLGAANEVVKDVLHRAIDEVGYATDEIGSAERAALLWDLFGDGGLWADRFPADAYHVSGRNSGSEGMELALRLVLESRFDGRRLSPRPGRAQRDIILAFEGAWHGWSGGLLPLLNKRHYRVGLPTLASDEPYGIRVEHIPFGDATAVREFFAANGDRVLAVVVEPVQGDAGVLLPPAGYLREISELCGQSGASLVADEVLTFAKTGQFFAMTDAGGPIPTDITVIGKSLGMGVLSTSMVIARRELTVRASGAVATSDLRPLTCAVIRDGLRHITSEQLVERSAAVGRTLSTLLADELVAQFPDIYQQSRGTGYLHGIELTEQAAGHLGRLRESLVRAGVYVECMSGAGRRTRGLPYVFPTIRVAPPLIATEDDVVTIVERLRDGSAVFQKGDL
jgi:acetylornithine/succinyldiaminopimelate/putrescine aminotransferase/acyl carrier protein